MIDRGNKTLREIARGTGISEKKVSQYFKGAIDLSSAEEERIREFIESAPPTIPAIVETKSPAVRKPKPVKKPVEDKMDILWQLEAAVDMPSNFHLVDTYEKLDAMCAKLHLEEFRILDTETYGEDSDEAKNPHHAKICGTSIWLPDADEGYWIPVKSNYMECLDRVTVATKLGEVMGEKAKHHISKPTVDFVVRGNPYSVAVPYKLITHNYAFDAHVCRYSKDIKEFKEDGYQLPRPFHDTLTASWLMAETEDHSLKALWNKYCCKVESEKADKFSKLFGTITMDKVPPRLATFYAIKDVKMTWELYKFQSYYLFTENLKRIRELFYNTEMPIVWIYYQSEKEGLVVDMEYLNNDVIPVLEEEVKSKYEAILRIYVEAIGTAPAQIETAMNEHRLTEVMKKNGDPYATPKFAGFNLRSNNQKQELIWDILKLTPPKSKKSEENPRSLDAKKVLKKMKKQHPVIELLLAYSKATKLYDAFAKALPKQAMLHPDGQYRVHPSIRGIGTKTLRSSQARPNCQQIPNNSIVNIRNVFISRIGRLLLSCDFS